MWLYLGPAVSDPDQTGQDFEALDHADAAASLEAFKQEIAHARAAVTGKQLDNVVPSHGHHPERTRRELDSRVVAGGGCDRGTGAGALDLAGLVTWSAGGQDVG